MKKQLQVWRLVAKSLEQNIPVMLLYVLESFGSSPGRAGFAMAVNINGEMEGSIGGGIMEHKFVEMAKEKLNYPQQDCTVLKQIHDKVSTKYQSGMICSGEQSNLLYKIQTTDITSVAVIINCIENNDVGTLTLSKKGIDFSDDVGEENIVYDYHKADDADWYYAERIGSVNHLYIIGAGHCALALSKIMSMMDFYIHLYDDRSELNTFNRNEYAHEKLIVNSYSELSEFISKESDYVVVMTFGYRTDDLVIRTLINRTFKYFGVLGSKKKIEKMMNTYRSEGLDETLLDRIHAPVGMPINSRTPEEIAISIAAQIIAIKNLNL